MFAEAIRYPTESDDWVRTVVIGGVLTLLGALIVPTFLVYGYVVRVMRSRFAGEAEPPRFDEWGTLLVDGFLAWLVSVVYLLVPLIVGGVTVGGAVVAIATGERALGAVGVAGLLGGIALTAILLLVFGYVAVAAVVNFAREGELSAAFDTGTLRRVCLDGQYAVAWLASVVLFLAVSVLSGALNAVPVLGVIAAPFLGFYASVAGGYLWADGYRAALDESGEFGPEAPEEAAV